MGREQRVACSGAGEGGSAASCRYRQLFWKILPCLKLCALVIQSISDTILVIFKVSLSGVRDMSCHTFYGAEQVSNPGLTCKSKRLPQPFLECSPCFAKRELLEVGDYRNTPTRPDFLLDIIQKHLRDIEHFSCVLPEYNFLWAM